MSSDDRLDELFASVPDPAVLTARTRKPASPVVAPAEPSPTRSRMKARRRLLLAASVAWPLLALLLSGVRPELSERGGFVAAQSILFGVLLMAAAASALAPGVSGLGAPVIRARAAVLAIPVLFALVGFLWLPPGASGSFGEVGPARAVLACAAVGLLVVAPLLWGALWAFRRSFAAAAGWRTAALGAALGLVASITLTIHCSSPLGGHIAVAHGLPILIGALGGAALGTRSSRA